MSYLPTPFSLSFITPSSLVYSNPVKSSQISNCPIAKAGCLNAGKQFLPNHVCTAPAHSFTIPFGGRGERAVSVYSAFQLIKGWRGVNSMDEQMLPSCGQAEQSSSDQLPSLWLHAYVTTVIIISVSIWRSDENAEKTSMLVPGMTASDRRWLMRAVIRESGLVCLCSWLEEVRIPTCGLSIADSMSWTRFPSESWSEETDRKERVITFEKNQLFSKTQRDWHCRCDMRRELMCQVVIAICAHTSCSLTFFIWNNIQRSKVSKHALFCNFWQRCWREEGVFNSNKPRYRDF